MKRGDMVSTAEWLARAFVAAAVLVAALIGIAIVLPVWALIRLLHVR